MPVFGTTKNKKIGDQLEKATRKAEEVGIGPLNKQDLCNYFMKVGIDNKGDLQSYQYAKGSTKTVEVKIDLVALAAACAGCPLPETPLIAEVGMKVSVTNTRNNLIITYVGPKGLKVGERDLFTPKSIVFLGMYGKKWATTVSVSSELGVKTPSISKDMPDPQGGGWSDQKAEVKSGTYAELCSFDISAKASIEGKAGISGERMYLSDPVPTYIKRYATGETGSSMTEINGCLGSMLEHGDKKQIIKNGVLAFLEAHGKHLERSWMKKHITGGQITTADLQASLTELEASLAKKPNELEELKHHRKALTDYHEESLLGPYSYLAYWSVKPEASVGMSAKASASVKVGVGVASAGAEAAVTVTGPSLETALKFAHYRLQIATPAEKRGGTAPAKTDPPSQYIIMSQDTKITYGQIDFTLVGVEAKAEASAKQGLIIVKDEHHLQSEEKEKILGKKEGKVGKLDGIAKSSMKGKVGLQETSASISGEAKLKKALNYMMYESAVAFWIPPAAAGKKKGEEQTVRLGQGSGFAFGQSVDLKIYWEQVQAFLAKKGSLPYFEGLAGALGVSGSQLVKFVKATAGRVDDLLHDKIEPSAFLLEASFAPPLTLKSVPVRWMNGRWSLGPFGIKESLRGILIGKGDHKTSNLQAIRLRYRLADEQKKDVTRFSLGVKYIVSLGIEYKSIELAGSEGIINVGTVWYGSDYDKYNKDTEQTTAYETAVPQVALLHQ